MDYNILKLHINNNDDDEASPIVVGGTKLLNLNISNTSSNIYLYNLSIYLTLPDGITPSSSDFPVTNSTLNSDGTTTYSYISLKDLAPLEANYNFNITLKCATAFKNKTTIAFGYVFNNISIKCCADTCPRGSYDTGNTIVYSTVALAFKASRFLGSLNLPAKVVKGAGTSATLLDYTNVYSAALSIYNNYIGSSTASVAILLDDGIRYLGNVRCFGNDSSTFLSPQVSSITINGDIYTQLYYDSVTISQSSTNNITFDYAVWNKYQSNTADLIEHGTSLNMKLIISSKDETEQNNSNFLALDYLISLTNTKPSTDATDTLQYNYSIKVGQYYDISNCTLTSTIPDGVNYISSSITPNSVVNNSDLKSTSLTYKYPILYTKSIYSLSVTAKISTVYTYKLDTSLTPIFVASFDSFSCSAIIRGKVTYTDDMISDSSNTSSTIKVPTVQKQFIKAYYSNGVSKAISALAPYDYVEYLLTYNPNSLKAVQKEIYVYDFLPLAINTSQNISYQFTGLKATALTPSLTTPNGVQFYYGNYTSNSISTVDLKASINSPDANSATNYNLLKMKGTNSSGYSYSSRTQLYFNLGSPNITLTKTVTGPSITAIKANEVYSYTIKLSNSSNLGTETDAFNFTLSDELSSWFTVNPNTVSIVGTGIYSNLNINASSISMNIVSLSPGQALTLTYSVTISNLLPPAVTIKTTCSTSNPYSQADSSYMYQNKAKTAYTTITSAAITISHSVGSGTFQVGSSIFYAITVTFPKGTICYNAFCTDTLPLNNQSLVSAYKNGVPMTVSVSKNIVTLPTENVVDARNADITITYTLNCKIINGSKAVGLTTSTQTNKFVLSYNQTSSSSPLTLTSNCNVTINHPNIVMNLTCKGSSIEASYSPSINININSIPNFKLTFYNNSSIKLFNGIIKIPVPSDLLYFSIDRTELCTSYYDTKTNSIIINISELDSLVSGFLNFTLVPSSKLNSGTSINTVATASQYYNELLYKIYNGETSNTCTCLMPPGCSLVPLAIDKRDDSTSFRVTQPGSTVTITNIFQNTGCGYDSYTLTISPIAISYTLFINNTTISYVSKNTIFSADLDLMKNISPNDCRTITLRALIPSNSAFGCRYDFIVTVKSKTYPYPGKTVVNIDPS